MPLLDFFKKWQLHSHTWKKLKADWKVKPKGPVNRYTKATMKHEIVRKTRPKVLPDLPAFNDEWTPAVKIEWLRTYKEIVLAIGEK